MREYNCNWPRRKTGFIEFLLTIIGYCQKPYIIEELTGDQLKNITEEYVPEKWLK